MIAEIDIQGERLQLLHHRAIFWEEQNTLIIADLHIGKIGHFRRHGIQVPKMAEQNNRWRLTQLLLDCKAKNVIFLGDLFHSTKNKAWSEFTDLLANFPTTEFLLIKGNHDILSDSDFLQARIMLLDRLPWKPFLFSHDRVDTDLYNLHGHIHPGVRLHGGGRQGLTLPCFFFSAHHGILPSFGDFTGMYKLKAKAGDKVYVIAEENVWKVA